MLHQTGLSSHYFLRCQPNLLRKRSHLFAFNVCSSCFMYGYVQKKPVRGADTNMAGRWRSQVSVQNGSVRANRIGVARIHDGVHKLPLLSSERCQPIECAPSEEVRVSLRVRCCFGSSVEGGRERAMRLPEFPRGPHCTWHDVFDASESGGPSPYSPDLGRFADCVATFKTWPSFWAVVD
jgi:hypothetical protein